jgi:hypothetical protein
MISVCRKGLRDFVPPMGLISLPVDESQPVGPDRSTKEGDPSIVNSSLIHWTMVRSPMMTMSQDGVMADSFGIIWFIVLIYWAAYRATRREG